jgi:hypothetical protein
MNLKEYMASDDPQMCWRLQSGDLVNLVDEATEEIERLHDVVQTLRWEINSLVWPGIISSGRAAEMEGMTVSEWWAGCEEVPGESYTRTKRERANLRTENERLKSIVDKILDYDHHNMQAGFDEADGAIDPMFYDDAADEDRLAKEALSEAVQLARKYAQASREMNEKAKETSDE